MNEQTLINWIKWIAMAVLCVPLVFSVYMYPSHAAPQTFLFRALVEAVEEVRASYNATPAQVALNWVIHFQGETIVTIPGVTKVHQAEESAEAMKFRLAAEELTQLDELSRGIK